MAGRRYTDEEIERLLDMADDGKGWGEIAKAIGRSYWGVKCKFLALGARRGRTGAWSKDEDAMLRRLALKGYSASEIGEVMDRTKNSIIGRSHRIGARLMGTPGGRKKLFRGKPLEVVSMNEAPENPALVELREDECHWPINNGGPFRYCGHKIEGRFTQYCPEHEALKWRPAKYQRVEIAA